MARESEIAPVGGQFKPLPRLHGFIPTRRFGALFILGVLPLAISFLVPGVRYWVALGDAALILLALLDRADAKRTRLEAFRAPKGRLAVGVGNPVVIQVRNLGNRPVRVTLRDDAPPEFTATGRTLDLLLAPFGRADRTYTVVPPKRGKFRFGDIHFRAHGPLGLMDVEATIPFETDARVYPDMRGAARLLLATASRDLANLGVRRLRRDGEGSEFARLREYVQGDSQRDIDWKATARRSVPVTRVYETERSQNVIICVDSGRTMAARVDQLTKLDYAVNAALFLAFVAIRNGDRVGLAVFADEVKAFLPPVAGRGQYRKIVEALFSAEPSLTFVDYQALFREVSTRSHRRSLVAIFTDLVDEDQAKSMVGPIHRLGRRHVPVCITLRDQALETLIRDYPADVDVAYRQAVANELLDERDGLKAMIAREGTQLLDAAPKDLTLAAVNRYLEVKRRQLL
jgi:uncharacterized protein (DUF58 family)